MSEAAINIQTANGKRIRNRVDLANARVMIQQARIEVDRLNREYKEELKQAGRARLTAFRSRRTQKSTTMSVTEFDHYTGQIGWPTTLRSKRFEKQRRVVEKELLAHIKQAGSNEAKLLNAVAALRKAVGKDARRLGYREFAASSNFVDRLRKHIHHSDQIVKHKEMLAKM